MKLHNVASDTQMTALVKNMVNAANLTWTTCGQAMLPLRWGAAHRAVVHTIRTTLEINNRDPLPTTVNEVARQIVDAVEWGNNAYGEATPEELRTVVRFLMADVPIWMRMHFIGEMAGGIVLPRKPGRAKSVQAVHSPMLLDTVALLNPNIVTDCDDGSLNVSVRRISADIKVITNEDYAHAESITYRIRHNRKDHHKDIRHMRTKLLNANGLVLLSQNAEFRTVSCLMPKVAKANMKAEWVIFNMPTNHYVRQLKLRLPTIQEN